MPVTRLKQEFLEQDGVRFMMEDENGSTVACRVSHEALRDHADRLSLPGADTEIFEAYRELIEQLRVMPMTLRGLSMLMVESLSLPRRSHE